jgi:hypothetical protein
MIDVQFFAANLWIVFVHMADFRGIDYFQRALHFHAVSELQQTLSNPADSYGFSSCLPVQLVRTLLYLSVNAKEEHLQSSSFVNQSTGFKMTITKGIVLPQLIEKLSRRQHNAMVNGNDSNPLMSASGLLGTIQVLFFDLVTTLPVGKGWKEFFASSASRFSALRERFTGILPSSGFAAADTKAQWNGKKVHSFYPQECFSQLLLLLLHHRNTADIFNPFRQAFSYLADLEMDSAAKDEEQDIEMLNMRSTQTALSVNYVHVNLHMIVEVISDMLPNPTYVLLLYSFLQMHPTFMESLRQLDISKTIIMNLLRGIYRESTLVSPSSSAQRSTQVAASSSSNGAQGDNSDTQECNISHLYTLAVCLLILIQDSMLFSRYAMSVVSMPWYKERSSSSMKLLDAVVVVMLRTLSFAVFRVQDSYLLSNVCAILMNVIASCQNLHPYSSERVVRTILTYARRIVKARQREHMLQQHHQQQQQQQQQHQAGSNASRPSDSVANTVLPTATPKFIQRGAHKWQVSYDAQDFASSYDGHGRLPPLASASLDHSWHNNHSLYGQHSTQQVSAGSGDPHNLISRQSITSLNGLDAPLELDISLVQIAFTTLLQFTVAVIKSRMVHNTFFLYALISDYASLVRYFPAHPLSTSSEDDNGYVTSYDAATQRQASTSSSSTAAAASKGVAEEKDTDASILAEQEDTAEWRVLYEDMQAVTAITEYYLIKFEAMVSNVNDSNSNGNHYFTAKEAAQFLKGQVLRHHQPSSISSNEEENTPSSAEDVEDGASSDITDRDKYQILLYRLHHGYIPSSSSTSMDEYFRARYCYQEADNASDFFVPHIWSNVVNIIGEERVN